MRKEKENRVIDNQFDRIHPLGILFHCQSTKEEIIEIYKKLF